MLLDCCRAGCELKLQQSFLKPPELFAARCFDRASGTAARS
jgi:hypothetical protein